jgi:deoxycytidylate deaminase
MSEVKEIAIPGGFDILSEDHKEFLSRCISNFPSLKKVSIGLATNNFLNKHKGKSRPFFDFSWRRDDLKKFMSDKYPNLELEILPLDESASIFQGKFVCIDKLNLKGIEKLKKLNVPFLTIDSINKHHTSDIESELTSISKQSKCYVRKVGAILLRNGKIIKKDYNAHKSCNFCPKYLDLISPKRTVFPFKNNMGLLTYNFHNTINLETKLKLYPSQIDCYNEHAEIRVLKHASLHDDLLVTCSPCLNCAREIVKNKIRRVTYIEEYWNKESIDYLRKNNISIRKAGVDSQ